MDAWAMGTELEQNLHMIYNKEQTCRNPEMLNRHKTWDSNVNSAKNRKRMNKARVRKRKQTRKMLP
jgi:hypothetical protein